MAYNFIMIEKDHQIHTTLVNLEKVNSIIKDEEFLHIIFDMNNGELIRRPYKCKESFNEAWQKLCDAVT